MYHQLQWDKIYPLLKTISVKREIIHDKYIESILKESYQSGFNLSLLQKSLVGDTELPLTADSFVSNLKNITRVGKKETTEGYAFISSYNTLKDVFIIKTSKTKEEEINILYEYFVGVLGINRLRNIIPNFACILGLFNYYPPDISLSDNGVVFNKNKEKQYYIIYEKINGISLHETLLKIKNDKKTSVNIQMIYSYILQLALVLGIAQDTINFTHYDLHTDNIMLRNIPQPIKVEYVYRGKRYKILTDKIPTLIDYGFTHFTIDNDTFGMKTMPNLNMYGSRTNRSYDLYKALMYICGALLDKRIIELIFGFYNLKTDNIMKTLDEGFKTFFALPKEYKDDYPPEKFIEYFLQKTKMGVDIQKEDYVELSSVSNYKDKITFIGQQDEYDKCTVTNSKSFIINNYIISELEGALSIVDNQEIRHIVKDLKKITHDNANEYKENDTKRRERYNFSLTEMKEIDFSFLEREIHASDNYSKLVKVEHHIQRINKFIEEYDNYRYFITYSKYSSPIKISDELHNLYHRAKNVVYQYNLKKKNILYYMLEFSMNDLLKKKNENINDYVVSLRDIVYAFENLKSTDTKTEFLMYRKILTLGMEKQICLYVPPKSRRQITQIWNSKSKYLLSKLFLKSFNFKDLQSVNEYIQKCITNKMNDELIFLDLRKYNKEADRDDRTENRIGKIKTLLQHSPPRITDDFTYLDLGCTDGDIAYTLGNYLNLKKSQIYGADVGDWVDVGQGKINENITYIQIPKSGKLPFSDNSFDMITVLMVLHHIEYIDERLQELIRILKPNGKLIIREHDCLSDENRMIHDIEHSIYEVSKKEEPDVLHLNTYIAWYRSRTSWNQKLISYGLTLKTSDGQTPNSATRGYYELYVKQAEEVLDVSPYDIKWTTGTITDDFPRAPYFSGGKSYPQGLKYSGLENTKYPATHWGQRKLLLSEIDFLNRLSKAHFHIVVYAGAADGRHIRVLVDMYQNVEFHLYDPREFHPNLYSHPRIKINPYYSEKNIRRDDRGYGYFTDQISEYYKVLSSKTTIVFISDIRSIPLTEQVIESNQRQQEKWIYTMKPVISMVKFKMPYPKYGENDTYTYLDGEIRAQCWAPSASAETRLIVIPPLQNKKRDTYKYEQNMSWYNLVLRNHDFSEDKLHTFNIPLDMTVREFWSKYVSNDTVLGFDFVYELMILTFYLKQYGNTTLEDYRRLMDFINSILMNKNATFTSYLTYKKDE